MKWNKELKLNEIDDELNKRILRLLNEKKKNYNIWKYEIKNENYNIWKYKMKNEIYWMKI